MFAEFSVDRCAHAGTPADADLTAFNSTCYEFVVKKGGSFQEARNYCKGRGGDLVHGFKVSTIRFYIYQVFLQYNSYIDFISCFKKFLQLQNLYQQLNNFQIKIESLKHSTY